MSNIYKTKYEFINFTGNVPLQLYAKKITGPNHTTYSIQPIAPNSRLIRWLQAHFSFINKIVLALMAPIIAKNPNCLILKDCKMIPNAISTDNLDKMNQHITEDDSDFFEDFKGSVNVTFPKNLFKATSNWIVNRYELSGHMPFVKIQPESILEQFHSSCILADPSLTEIKVYPLDQNLSKLSTVDAGGPSRQFISDLFDSLLKKATQDQTSILKFESTIAGALPVITGDTITEEEKRLYQTIGKIMQICSVSVGNLRIGQIFHPAVFNALSAIKPSMANCDMDDLNDNEVLALFSVLKNGDASESLKKLFEFLNLSKPSNNQGFLGKIYSYATNTEGQLREMLNYAYDYAGEERPAALQGEPSKETLIAYFDTMKLEIEKQIISRARDDKTLPAILNMGRFLTNILSNNFMTSVQGVFSKEASTNILGNNLMTSVQGVFSKEVISSAIHCNNSKTKNYLKKWINESSEEDVQTFVTAATGSKTISQSTFIYINGSYNPDRLPDYHTCTNTVDIAEYKTYEIFKKKLEQSFACLQGSSYQFV